eukprot:CAMPEP_0194317798 /NCGR_PEP_ID=MMETSP0171-20130528/14522_1 /TAXON_ID=218684 /ORGANISM="Corethron pennatum, Strain L29A3" /LENGTH=499 /DNA_ID=CAMNT_0039074519 /DNA_START=157 /DNA_END=1656 /DNA_ORIENTATION=+
MLTPTKRRTKKAPSVIQSLKSSAARKRGNNGPRYDKCCHKELSSSLRALPPLPLGGKRSKRRIRNHSVSIVAAALLIVMCILCSVLLVLFVGSLECGTTKYFGVRCGGGVWCPCSVRGAAATTTTRTRPRVTNVDPRASHGTLHGPGPGEIGVDGTAHVGAASGYRGPADAVERRIRIHFPTCNALHEIDMGYFGDRVAAATSGSDARYRASGGVRDVWELVRAYAGADGTAANETIALKTLRWQKEFIQKTYKMHVVDAFAMERLTFSPHVVNAYGYCGQTVLTEIATGKLRGGPLSLGPPSEALRIAAQAASGLADAHAFGSRHDENFVIVHRDVTPKNFVVVKDGVVKINDFNAGRVLSWDRGGGAPAPDGFAHHDCTKYRSPEECADDHSLTHKVDVYSFGHILFYLLTGTQPYLNNKQKQLHKLIVSKQLVPSDGLVKYRNSTDPAVVAMMGAMAGCYTFDRDNRPEMAEIAAVLDQALLNITAVTPERTESGT